MQIFWPCRAEKAETEQPLPPAQPLPQSSYWSVDGPLGPQEGAGPLFGPLFQYSSVAFELWPLLSAAQPPPLRSHRGPGLPRQPAPLTFRKHLHLLLIKWTDPTHHPRCVITEHTSSESNDTTNI